MEVTLVELLDHVPVFVRRPNGEILHWTDGCHDLYGYTVEEATGSLAHELLKTEFPAPHDEISAELAVQGRWSGRLRQTTRSGRTIWTETLLLQRESTDPGGPIVVEQSTDISGRVDLEEKNALLARELQHRVRNILAVVQALARMSFPDAPADQRRTMEERIAALGDAVELLQQSAWKEAELGAIVAEVARSLGIDGRLAAEGPDVGVTSDDAMGLSLALHELSTNALKYGALSRPDGRVTLSWRNDPDDPEAVAIRWKESGGPPVVPPSRTGFGTLLIRRAIAGAKQPTAEIDYAPDGVTCELRVRRARGESEA